MKRQFFASFCTRFAQKREILHKFEHFRSVQSKSEQFTVGQRAAGLTAVHAALAEEFVQNSVQKLAKKMSQRVGAQAC